MKLPDAEKDDLYETRQVVNLITKGISVPPNVFALLLRAANAGQSIGYASGYRDGYFDGREKQVALLNAKIQEIKKRKGL